jgi:hypothetical protein
MKVLLDENLPVKLKHGFSSAIEVYTVHDMKWNSLKNGELLKSLVENDFDALLRIKILFININFPNTLFVL